MIYPILTYSRDIGDFTHNLEELYNSGLKAIRLIYKGKSEETFDRRIREIQEKISEHTLEMDILIDLPGSKPIVGDLGPGLQVISGIEYQITEQNHDTSLFVIPTIAFFTHENFSTLAGGDIISIADDELNLVVIEVKDDGVSCKALNSFHLTSNRSISVKNKPFDFKANSEKDMLFVQNMKHTQTNVKLLVSFTKNANDLRKLALLQPGINLIPKIESILDDATLLEIMAHCNTLMLGRGDLSTSSQPNELFYFQKRLIGLCKTHNKQLIIGTGLLAGIADKEAPTISEVMDYGYLRDMGIEAFLIAGSNAHKRPLETLQFMRTFEL